jgi:hypothetical protein
VNEYSGGRKGMRRYKRQEHRERKKNIIPQGLNKN